MADLGALLLSFPPPAYPVAVTASHPAFSTLGVPVDASNGHRAVAVWLEQTVAPDPFLVHTGAHLSGVVMAAENPVPRAVVRVFFRSTGVQVAAVRADDSGNFRVDGLSTDAAAYSVVAFDPDGGVMYNAAIFDRLTPVTTPYTAKVFPAGAGFEQHGAHTVALATPTDPNWADVVSLLSLNGANASTTFTDAKSRTWSGVGNAQLSTAQKKFGSASLLLDGSGDYIVSSSSAFDVAQSDCTVEFWVYPTSTPGKTMTMVHLNAGSNGGLHIHRNTSGQLVVDNGLVGTTAGSVTIPLNQWTHIAVVRLSGVIYGYVGGALALSHSVQTYAAATQCQIGRYFIGPPYTSDFVGYIDEVRITSGVARYTGAFTPPTEAFPAG